ncbi:MAG TPA: hypothetical protein VHU17_18480 [Acidimicrobiales bacterium]|nr:hypothetical protein [Acidimicrobiales bacterium]
MLMFGSKVQHAHVRLGWTSLITTGADQVLPSSVERMNLTAGTADVFSPPSGPAPVASQVTYTAPLWRST